MTETTIRGQKGMTSVKEMPVLQDGPPPGGFPAVRYARRIANSGPSGVTVLLVSSVVIGWGMYQVGQGNIYRRCAFLSCDDDAGSVEGRCALLEPESANELKCIFSGSYGVVTAGISLLRTCALNHILCCPYCRGLKAEKLAARQAILPLIQAEEDARFVF